MQIFMFPRCIVSDAMSGKQTENRMTGDAFVKQAQNSGLTERQAIALFNRRVANVSRQETAQVLGTSASNVDNLERAAREKVMKAHNLVELVREVDIEPNEL